MRLNLLRCKESEIYIFREDREECNVTGLIVVSPVTLLKSLCNLIQINQTSLLDINRKNSFLLWHWPWSGHPWSRNESYPETNISKMVILQSQVNWTAQKASLGQWLEAGYHPTIIRPNGHPSVVRANGHPSVVRANGHPSVVRPNRRRMLSLFWMDWGHLKAATKSVDQAQLMT